MFYEEFLVNYARQHPEMTPQQVVDNARIAWKRLQNAPTGDLINTEHLDRVMDLDMQKAMRSIGASVMGSVKSERKAATSAANGRKGGRPRKS